jgi:hypothetical protein
MHDADTHTSDSLPETKEYYFFDSPASSSVKCSDGSYIDKEDFLELVDTGKMVFIGYQNILLGKHHYKPQSVGVFHRRFATLDEMQELVRNSARSLSQISRLNKQNKRLLTQEWLLEEKTLQNRLKIQKATLLYLQQHPITTEIYQTLQPQQEKIPEIERLWGVFEQLSGKKHIGAAYKVAQRMWEADHDIKKVLNFTRHVHDVFHVAQQEGIAF